MSRHTEPRAGEPTEKRIVEVTADGTIVSSEPVDPMTTAPRQVVQQPPPQIVRVKSGGSGALMLFSLVLVLVIAGLGYYVYQTRDDTVAKQQAQLELEQQRAVAEQKLQELGRAADSLGDQVRDTQRDLGIPATQPQAATPPAATTPAPVQPATPAQPAPAQPTP